MFSMKKKKDKKRPTVYEIKEVPGKKKKTGKRQTKCE